MAFNNIKVGTSSLQNITSGDGNIVIGDASGLSLTTHSNNVYIGHGLNPTPQSNKLLIQQNGTTLLSGDFLSGALELGTTGYIDLADIASPANAADGQGRLYKKTGDIGLYWLPDSDGAEIDLTTSGGTNTLQEAYDASTTPEFTLDDTRGALTVRDALTPLGTNLLEVEDFGSTTTYLAVNNDGIDVIGDITVTGTVDGVDLATLDTTFSAHTVDSSDPHTATWTQTNANMTNVDVSTSMTVDTVNEYTLDAGTLVDGNLIKDGYIEQDQVAAPTGVSTDKGRFYYGTDGKPHFLADDGDIESDYDLAFGTGIASISAGSSGEQSFNSGITMSSNAITTTGAIALAQVPSVTPGNYVNSDIAVDSQGRIIEVTSGKISSGSITAGTPAPEGDPSGLNLRSVGFVDENFTTPETSQWQVPAGVTSINVVAVGGGGGGGGISTTNSRGSGGGGGGGLAFNTSIAVTPGETLNLVIGAGGTAGAQANAASGNGGNGGNSSISRGATTLLLAGGGSGGHGGGFFSTSSNAAGGVGNQGTLSTGGGNGGTGGAGQSGGGGGGGGGAAGYSGNGGNAGGGNNGNGLSGAGGGGGGGGGISTSGTEAPGGGVGLGGEGASGTGGTTNNPGTAGSGGSGTLYGGGGGGREDDSAGTGFAGGSGAIRISYASNAITISMEDVGISGSFVNTSLTVDQTGRITAASSGVATGVSGTGTDNQVVRWDGTSALQGSAITIDDSGNVIGYGGNLSFGSTGAVDALMRFRSGGNYHVWLEAYTDGYSDAWADFIITNDNAISNTSFGLTGNRFGVQTNSGYFASGSTSSQGFEILTTSDSSSVSVPPEPATWTSPPVRAMFYDIPTTQFVFGNNQTSFATSSRHMFTGVEANAITGPSMEWYTDADQYPLMQFLEWQNGNEAILFDTYFTPTFTSSDSGSNYWIHKINDQVYFRYDSGKTPGNAISINTAFTMDITNQRMVIGTPGLAFTNTPSTTSELSYYDRTTHSTTFSSAGSTTTTSPEWDVIRIGSIVTLQCSGSPEDTTPENDEYDANTPLPTDLRPAYQSEQIIPLINNTSKLAALQVATSGVITLFRIEAIETGFIATWQEPQITFIA